MRQANVPTFLTIRRSDVNESMGPNAVFLLPRRQVTNADFRRAAQQSSIGNSLRFGKWMWNVEDAKLSASNESFGQLGYANELVITVRRGERV